MRIKSLTLHGFKSFADRTEIDLHEGITAVVGPNGCGKSNISDALRWVLGEQRPTAIRGSRMEEAIFGGTAERRPIHRAEVSLALSNEDGTLSLPYSEVVIGRTVHRGGESDYALNGASCRLKDIQDLCRDTGLGANAYAVIENRMIDAILSDRAEERRALFEEAAEIGRYKDRRRTALRRLEQAEADVQRLDDVLGEVQSKVRSLAAQRGRADRYRRLRDRRLQLEVACADARLERTARALERAEEELEALRDRRPGEETALRTAETEAEALRVRLAERERERSAAARRLEESRRAVEARERERLVAEERAAAARERIAAIDAERERLALRRAEVEAEGERAEKAAEAATAAVAERAERSEGLAEEAERLDARRRSAAEGEAAARARLEEAERALGRLRAEREAAEDRLAERSEELASRREAARELEAAESELRETEAEAAAREADAAAGVDASEARVEAAREALEARRAEARTLRDRLAEAEGTLSSLRARQSSLESFLASGGALPPVVRALLEEGAGGARLHGVLADAIRAPADLATAVEAHLGAYLHAILVEGWRDVERLRAWLRTREGEDGLLLLPLDPGPAGPGTPPPASGRSLLDAVEVQGRGADWARSLLGDVALAEAGAPPERGAWVRADGVGQDARGAVRLGRPGGGRGALRPRAELEALRDRTAEAAAARERLRGELEAAEARAAEAEAAALARERELEEAARARRDAAAEREAAEARRERLAAERREAARRIETLEDARASVRGRAEEEDARLAELKAAREAAEAALAEARAAAEAAREAWEAARDRLHDLQLEAARAEADVRAASDARRRAARALEELDARARRLAEERRGQEEAVQRGRAALETGEEELDRLLEAHAQTEGEMRAAERRLDEGRAELDEREAALREARRTEREHAERRHALELEVAELRAARASVRERLETEWDATLEELRPRVEPPEPEAGGSEAWEEELEDVRRGLARLGPVNLLAEEEYEEEKERLDFLLAQREDLVEARDDLRDSIRRINRTAADAFEATFDQVRENFRRTFRTLFEGGECDLWLEDPEDPLDSAIEISASPRGKRTQRIHLLSGGERALTALALLFAIYLAKPSPFCLLDEVDAPLDETNVLRFVRMLERFKSDTQFIVITHNPRTIEAADWIYGVTMQEPGVSSIVGVTFDEMAGQVA